METVEGCRGKHSKNFLLREMMRLVEGKEGTFAEDSDTEQICLGLEALLHNDIWSGIEDVINSGSNIKFEVRKCFEAVRQAKEVTTAKGKSRLYLRHLLQHGLLATALKYLAYDQQIINFAEMLDEQGWQLDLENCCWLDCTLELPVRESHLLVPTADLGVYITMVSGKPIVTKVLRGSVAAEDGKVEIGDTITHINNQLVVNTENISRDGMDRIFDLLGKSKGKPITLTLTKAWNHKKLELFPPIVPVLKQLRINVEDLQRTYFLTRRGTRRRSDDDEDYNPLEEDDEDQGYNERMGYDCLYMGSVNIGARREMDQVEVGIQAVLSRSPTGLGHPAVLKLQELDVSLTRPVTKEVVMAISYPNIASCGRVVAIPKYFAFITSPLEQAAGNMCHVFYAPREATVKEILENIAEGFNRTSCTV